jgi:hypothetical protein
MSSSAHPSVRLTHQNREARQHLRINREHTPIHVLGREWTPRPLSALPIGFNKRAEGDAQYRSAKSTSTGMFHTFGTCIAGSSGAVHGDSSSPSALRPLGVTDLFAMTPLQIGVRPATGAAQILGASRSPRRHRTRPRRPRCTPVTVYGELYPAGKVACQPGSYEPMLSTPNPVTGERCCPTQVA